METEEKPDIIDDLLFKNCINYKCKSCGMVEGRTPLLNELDPRRTCLGCGGELIEIKGDLGVE